MHLSWNEGGIVVEQKAGRKGFGSEVLTYLAPAMIGAKTAFDINAKKINWTISIPSEHFYA